MPDVRERLLRTEVATPHPLKHQDRFRAVVIHDPHLTYETPSAYKIPYWPMMKDVLERTLRFAEEQSADCVLWSGDIFHRKAPTKNPLHFIHEVIRLLRTSQNRGTPNLAIAGNHDVKYGTWTLGLEGQPFETLMEAGVVQLLDLGDHAFTNGKGLSVRVAGASYHHARAHEARDRKKQQGETLITLGHFWFGRKTTEFFGEPVYGPDFFKGSATDIYAIGHHHEDQGIQEIKGRMYVVQGAITRTGAHKQDTNRRPAAALIEVIEGQRPTAKTIRPRYPSVEESLDLEKREQLRVEEEQLEAFTKELRTAEITVREPGEILEEIDPEASVKERTKKYLEEAEATTG